MRAASKLLANVMYSYKGYGLSMVRVACCIVAKCVTLLHTYAYAYAGIRECTDFQACLYAPMR